MAIYTSSTWRKLHLIVTSVAGPGGAFGASETAQFAFTLINAKLMNTGPDPGTVVVVAALVADEVQPTTATGHVATIKIFRNIP